MRPIAPEGPIAKGLKLLSQDGLLNQDNYPSWSRSVQDLALSEGIWGFITGERKKELKALLASHKISDEKYDELLNKGKEKALGLLRRTVSEVYLEMIDDCTKPEKAWKKLKRYFKARTVRNDSDLTARFTSLKMDVKLKDAAEAYILEFKRIERQLVDAQMILPERMKRAVFIHGIAPELDTVRVLMQKSEAGIEELQKDLIEAYEDHIRKQKPSQEIVKEIPRDLALITRMEEALTQFEERAMAAATNGRFVQKQSDPRTSRKRKRCPLCSGPRHELSECMGNPQSSNYVVGWLEERNLRRKIGEPKVGTGGPHTALMNKLPEGMKALLTSLQGT
jgi:hypothetical protein